ncbi:phospholipase D-like domain-containing protein [Kitasatospora sp. A2-31]|uniref:phospholipase D-like domain-containing protein n=1 Tax=Kitasatospora sp. A2-31 TaxID=2916414 RepID=UPI001EEA55A5|nr:phospholipase D-like domain-containing protein [Kitasatospora sp. A2-31]MCG6497711.1 phospholipase D-like domain-containing protein [Kitasatospora sp. A2-31]
MSLSWSRRSGRLVRAALAAAAATTLLAVVPPLPAHADTASGTAGDAADTAHLDAVERALREVAPGLEGTVWQRTAGNSLHADAGNPAGWLLQTPGCWGDAACTDRPGTRALLDRMRADVSAATRTVDVSTLAPFPNGGFQDALVDGLKASVAAGNRLQVRILVGAAPVYNVNVLPSRYRDELVAKLGPAAGSVTLTVASMTTSRTALSWNHSKLLVVDGRSVVAGGINGWKDDYLDTAHPVSDVDLALTGPAATSAARYLDTLWEWTCGRTGVFDNAWFASSNGGSCRPSLERDLNPAAPATGTVPVIAVGGLGVGIKTDDPSSAYRQGPVPGVSDTKCGPLALHDNTNADRDYETVNPEENALRALVSSATSHVEISQQDMNGTCPPLPRYDARLYELLAAKLAAGVKVRIVVSDPANRGAVGSGGYSQIKSLSEISDVLKSRLTALTGDPAKAGAALCGNLQLASFRVADAPTWADGHPYQLHHKLVAVDGSTFYIGSKNLYPAWLQDFGYVVEDKPAAAQLDRDLLAPQWRYSRAAATVDWTTGLCRA